MQAIGSKNSSRDNMKLIRIIPFALGALLIPGLVLAAGATDQTAPKQLVNCGNDGQPMCTFDNLIGLGKVIIDFSLFALIIPLSVLSFAVAGFKYLLAFGNEAEATKVHGQVTATVKGVFVAFFAWLAVSSLFNFFVSDTFNPFK